MSEVHREIDPSVYDEDYFERGPQSGKSCYRNYRWIPELTLPMAMTIIDCLQIRRGSTILDIGCAKGYLVKAFRLLYRKAWGVDVSPYAIDHVDPCSREFCHCIRPSRPEDIHRLVPDSVDFCIAKDVFEHVPLDQLCSLLINVKADVLFAVIPLGSNGKYVAADNNFDVTHVNCMGAEEWIAFFENSGWRIKSFRYKVEGIKDAYYEKFPKGHGFFTLI